MPSPVIFPKFLSMFPLSISNRLMMYLKDAS